MLFKDDKTINRIGEQNNNITKLADAIRNGELHHFLFKEVNETKKTHNPFHERCSFSNATVNGHKKNEKRMCRCMYYYNNEENDKQYKRCREKCQYAWKWKLLNCDEYRILDYEVPSSYVIKGIGGVDLIIDDNLNKYAVEVKPEDSTETIVRMIAEILTYVEDEKFKGYKPAICFFEGSKQHEELEKLKSNKDFRFIIDNRDISIFYISIKKRDQINEFEICRFIWSD